MDASHSKVFKSLLLNMRFRFWHLLFWFFLVDILFSLRNDLYGDLSIDELFDWVGNTHLTALQISSTLTSFVYTILTYTVLFFTRQNSSAFQRVFLLILVAPIVMVLRYFIEEVIIQSILGKGNYPDTILWQQYLLDNIYYAVLFIPIGIVYFYVQFSRFKEKQRQELITETQKTELAFLRSQINPHFLFNSLNNIYSLSESKSTETSKAIEKLSNLLRYTLYEKKEVVSVEKEVNYLKNFIELQRMRYDYEIQLTLQIDSNLLSQKVPPFLFIPFVENAFKHGDLSDINNPLQISLEQKSNKIFFFVQNKKNQQVKDPSGGIGLENIKKRLLLIYEKNHELHITDIRDMYTVELTIPMSI